MPETLVSKLTPMASKVLSLIRRVMAEKGITAYRLAKETGISQSHMTNLMNGKRRMTTDVAVSIAQALEIDPKGLKMATFFEEMGDEEIQKLREAFAGEPADDGDEADDLFRALILAETSKAEPQIPHPAYSPPPGLESFTPGDFAVSGADQGTHPLTNEERQLVCEAEDLKVWTSYLDEPEMYDEAPDERAWRFELLRSLIEKGREAKTKRSAG